MIPGREIIILLLSGIFLTGAAHVVIRQSIRLARRFGLSDFTMGFLLLGLFTSMPELFVAIQSVSDGIPQLSVGNLLGGSILLLSFVIGVTSIIQGKVALDHRLTRRELFLMIGVIAAPIAVLWDGQLTRIEGGVLVGLYILHSALLNHGNDKKTNKAMQSRHGLVQSMFLLVLGIATLFISSRIIVTQAESLMRIFSITPVLFGLFFLSIGTNLPELALAMDGIRARRKEIAFGDFLGSSAANTLILGAIGLVSPFSAVGHGRIPGATLILAALSLYFLWAASSGRSISRREGIGLLGFYILFALYELAV